MNRIKVQWNPEIAMHQGTGKITALYVRVTYKRIPDILPGVITIL